ncbi:carbohydrate ABC transporter permease [Spirochaeta isovalerica]|uniref:Raffinose/stachyose/melibiose transport system permease protein n=1 Tax=Spirochaeta isovalerica TaxID=150 RepID=A0A841R8R7_9SPIO|nr:sugar ABC transporter permease [Spirochaeta isovalerica]MBB6481674.1 raffinose/stachyose/melibiose transport system permease protein [Spirochaeta isovalerica]
MLQAQKKHARFLFMFIFPAFIIYTVFMLLPILNSMKYSLYSGDGLIPDTFVGLDNYVKLFTEERYFSKFWNALGNNIKFFLIVTFIQNILGFFMAVFVTRSFKGNKFMRKLSFLPTTLSVLVVGFIFKLILNPYYGVFDKVLEAVGLGKFIIPWLGDPRSALIIVSIAVSWQFFGESVLFYSSGIDGIDDSILEAARIDGANIWHEIIHIILPSVLPIVGIVTILIFIGDFTQFDIVYAMTGYRGDPGYSTDLMGSLFYRTAFATTERGGWGTGMGAAVATMMFIIVTLGVGILLAFFNKKKEDMTK